MRRESGLIVPLFSLVSSRGWGIGEFADLGRFARWAAEAGQSVLQILPVGEMPPDERSPYSSMTAMALDPIYLSLPDLPDFAGLGGELAFESADEAALEALRLAPRIRYSAVRRLKSRWLRRSWERFVQVELHRGSTRARQFEDFIRQEAWWLEEYATFRALHAEFAERRWQEWPEALGRAEPQALAQARADLETEIAYYKYLQWIAAEQWAEANRQAWPTRVFGDLPFMISADSPDVWARQHEFRFDATIGVPPDAFSETGQDWGLPPWRWDVMAGSGFAWMRMRAARYAALFDGYRIDHLVGLYRTYIRPIDKSVTAFFEPAEESTQTELGEMLVGILRLDDRTQSDEAPRRQPEIIAEDLGLIPTFVRESMRRLGLPGMKVLRWERHWELPGQPPVDPRDFPPLSVATTGTHDIDPLAATEEGDTDEKREAHLHDLLESRSNLTLMLLQDAFGWADRINTPAVVDEMNWTWRLRWPVDEWLDRQETMSRARILRDWTRSAGR
ncbi:MAG: 4-alpha-glucanotransferase [Vicinamibacterales bacterium]